MKTWYYFVSFEFKIVFSVTTLSQVTWSQFKFMGDSITITCQSIRKKSRRRWNVSHENIATDFAAFASIFAVDRH